MDAGPLHRRFAYCADSVNDETTSIVMFENL